MCVALSGRVLRLVHSTHKDKHVRGGVGLRDGDEFVGGIGMTAGLSGESGGSCGARAVLLTRVGPVAQIGPTHGLCQGDDLHAGPIAHGPVGLLWVCTALLHHLQLFADCEERISVRPGLPWAQPASNTPGLRVTRSCG